MKSGGRTLPVLPNEVITEILSWVPVKPLIRFRCVCKFWKSLISDPHLITLHRNRSPNNANLIVSLISTITSNHRFVMSCSKASFIQDTHVTSADQVLVYHGHIIGSCNGLVCCLHSPSRQEFCVSFWNPERRLASRYSTCLHVDSHVYPRFGYGYDKSSDSYKVVALLLNVPIEFSSKPKPTAVKVYTMGQHCWRDIPAFPGFPASSSPKEGIFLSGTLNWVAKRNPKLSYKELVIVSLDLVKETYKQFLLPTGFDDGIGNGPPYTAILGDYLCLFLDYKRTHLLVWQMKEFGVEKSWTRFLKVSYQHLQIGDPVLFLSLEPLCMSENGDVLVFVNGQFEIILYNWRGNTVEVGNYGNHERRIDAKDHMQSLVLPY